jgi:hypothetical protein
MCILRNYETTKLRVTSQVSFFFHLLKKKILSQQQHTQIMILGFSLSPGGLLLPYHLGALAALAYHGYITDSTPLAGSSAGAITVASHASGVPCLRALDASIRVSSKCWNPLFVPTGGLLPCLRHELDQLLPQDAHARLNDRKGIVALAHRELFPTNQAVMKTHFDTRNCLLDSVCDSSTFPYFLTNQPARVVQRKNKIVPRIVVDGVFACPLERILGVRNLVILVPTTEK